MSWLQRLLRTRRMEKELDSELRFHFESQVADKMAGGLPEAEARRATRLEFGGLAQVKEDCRESRGTLWVASIAQDLRFGARMLMRSPGFALTSILVLALGIGVSTLAFSLYNLIALQSIPVRDPGNSGQHRAALAGEHYAGRAVRVDRLLPRQCAHALRRDGDDELRADGAGQGRAARQTELCFFQLLHGAG